MRYLQVAVSDISAFSFVVEDAEMISETITRFATFEQIYLQSTSSVVVKLRSELEKLYRGIVNYLVELRKYFEQSSLSKCFIMHDGRICCLIALPSLGRVIKNATIGVETFALLSKKIKDDATGLRWYASMINFDTSATNHSELRRLLTSLDQPINRMYGKLEIAEDRFQSKSEKHDSL